MVRSLELCSRTPCGCPRETTLRLVTISSFGSVDHQLSKGSLRTPSANEKKTYKQRISLTVTHAIAGVFESSNSVCERTCRDSASVDVDVIDISLTCACCFNIFDSSGAVLSLCAMRYQGEKESINKLRVYRGAVQSPQQASSENIRYEIAGRKCLNTGS